MPFRGMGYDGASYRSQMLKTKEKIVNGKKKIVKVKERYPAIITHVDEFLKLMRVLTGDNRYETISFTEQEKKEGVRMCKVLDAREKRGEAKGLKRGAARLHELMRILTQKGYQMEEILKMTSEEESREMLYKEYGIV